MLEVEDVIAGVAVAGGYLSEAQVEDVEKVQRTVRSSARLDLALADIAARKGWLSEGRARELAHVAKVVYLIRGLHLDEPSPGESETLGSALSVSRPARADAAVAHGDRAEPPTLAADGLCTQLGSLPPGTLVTLPALATMLCRHKRSIERAVQRRELPPPTRMMGRKTWTIGAVLAHVEKRLKEAAREAERHRRQIERHMSGGL